MGAFSISEILSRAASTIGRKRSPQLALEPSVHPLWARWARAAEEAELAYRRWSRRRDAESFAAYRACADRADAAQDELAAGAR
jgi:hypothetical protein